VIDLDALHLLRPQWLWALLPIAIIALLLVLQQGATARWRGLVAPHLLEHLIVRPGGRWRLRPAHFLVVALVVATLALSGPTWRREPPPFTEDTAPLVIALDLSLSMTVRDIQPSRLERAQQKVRDLLAERKGAKTALLAYAGTAHAVLPLTDDPSIIESFVTALDPSVMPVAGKDAAAALDLAKRMLQQEATPGTVLFITDGIARDSTSRFVRHSNESRDQLVVLAVGTEAGGMPPGGGELHALDIAGFEALGREAGAAIVFVTVDDSDVRRVLRGIDTHLNAVQQENAEGRWLDEGWWLAWLAAIIVLFWFRRGWLVQWEV
jgi:Ca-activated chloride channel family protein